jgi:hypothetical protein
MALPRPAASAVGSIGTWLMSDAAGDSDVDHARAHEAGGEVGGLLGRPALGVDGRRHGERRPAVSQAVRARLNDCIPIWLACPDDLPDLGRSMPDR